MNLGPDPKELAKELVDQAQAKLLPDAIAGLKELLIGRTITVTDLIPGRTFTIVIQ